jgi:hypothetical protein
MPMKIILLGPYSSVHFKSGLTILADEAKFVPCIYLNQWATEISELGNVSCCLSAATIPTIEVSFKR